MEYKELIKEVRRLPSNEREALLEASLAGLLAIVFQHVFKLIKDKTETEDIVQETFMQFLDSREPDWFEFGNINLYLLRTADSVCITHLTKHTTLALDNKDTRRERPTSAQPLSQRLHGILKFDGAPPNDEEVKDMIADYLIRKYS